jgi:hypothetical protein
VARAHKRNNRDPPHVVRAPPKGPGRLDAEQLTPQSLTNWPTERLACSRLGFRQPVLGLPTSGVPITREEPAVIARPATRSEAATRRTDPCASLP